MHKFADQRQAQERKAGRLLDGPQGRLQTPGRTGGDNKPQVVAVPAHIVLIHFRKTIDGLGDDRQLLRRHRHGGQRAGADALWREDRADTSDLPFAPQPLQHAQHRAFSHPQLARQFGKGRRTQRKILLPFAQEPRPQTIIEHIRHHRHQSVI